MTPRQFLLILRARYRLFLLVLLVTVAVAATLSLMLPKKYTATATVLVDVRSPDPIAGVLFQAMMIPGYMATQVDIINSKQVAQRAATLLKLTENPQVREQWMAATGGKGRLEVWLAEALQKNLDVKPSRESNVIDISYRSLEPAFAASLANAFTRAYLETTIELRAQPARQYAEWFGEQGKSLRENLEKAQARLSEYQRNHRIVASDERLDNETAKLNELSSQLTLVQGQTTDARSKERSTRDPETLSDVLQNPVIVQLKSQIAILEGKLQELGGNVGRNHPQYQRQESEIATLKQQQQAEIRRIVSGLSTSAAVGKVKESDLRNSIEAQKGKLLQSKRERDELLVLTRDVDAAQRAYETVTQRFSQASLEGQSTQTNISVLAPATEPVDPSYPRTTLNIVIAVFLGGLLAVAAAFLLELLDQRLRSADDVEALLALSLLGEIPKRRSRQRVLRLGFGRYPVAVARGNEP